MIEKLLEIVSILGQWGYLLIFLAAFLESSAFMGLLVPGESIVVIAGVLSYQGYLDLFDAVAVIAVGAVLGDSVGYALGKRLGRGYFDTHKRLLFLKGKHIDKTDRYFELHGGKTIFFGRWVGFLRAMAPFAAGMSRMPYKRFLAYNVFGGVLWAVFFTLLGYFFSKSWQLIETWTGRAGTFVFFAVLVTGGFAYIYRSMVKKQAEMYEWVRQKTARLASLPVVRGFAARHPRIVSFVAERLSPRSYLGLHLTAGLLASAVFVWMLGEMIEGILTGDPFSGVERWVLNQVYYFRNPFVDNVMLFVTSLGSAWAMTLGSVGVALVLMLKRRTGYLIAYGTAIFGGSILVFILKAIVHRARPAVDGALIKLSGWSFPSGHAMMSVIFYGIIAYFIVRDARSWRLWAFTVTVALFLVFAIGFSRLYLQAHYLSDIGAGYAGGLFWLTMCLTGLEVHRKQKEAKGHHSAGAKGP